MRYKKIRHTNKNSRDDNLQVEIIIIILASSLGHSPTSSTLHAEQQDGKGRTFIYLLTLSAVTVY